MKLENATSHILRVREHDDDGTPEDTPPVDPDGSRLFGALVWLDVAGRGKHLAVVTRARDPLRGGDDDDTPPESLTGGDDDDTPPESLTGGEGDDGSDRPGMLLRNKTDKPLTVLVEKSIPAGRALRILDQLGTMKLTEEDGDLRVTLGAPRTPTGGDDDDTPPERLTGGGGDPEL